MISQATPEFYDFELSRKYSFMILYVCLWWFIHLYLSANQRPAVLTNQKLHMWHLGPGDACHGLYLLYRAEETLETWQDCQDSAQCWHLELSWVTASYASLDSDWSDSALLAFDWSSGSASDRMVSVNIHIIQGFSKVLTSWHRKVHQKIIDIQFPMFSSSVIV